MRRTTGRQRGGAARLASGAAAVLREARELFPLTALGLALGALSAAGLRWLAYGQLDLVVLVAAYGALGLLAVSLLAVLPVAALAWRWLRRGGREAIRPGSAGEEPPRWVEAGRPMPTGFSLPALGWLPLVRLQLRWEAPAEAHAEGVEQAGRLQEQVRFEARGRFERAVRRLRVEDPFGLVRVGLRRAAAMPLRVLPWLGALRRVPLLRSMSGGEEWPHPMGLQAGDRLELRRYAPGDPARFIHWRAFARTRKLVVRVPERALSRARRTVAFLVTGEGDEASAAAARAVLEGGALGEDWSFGADGGHLTDRLAEALDMICDSAGRRERGGTDLERFLQEAERRGPASLVLFCPCRPGPWLGRVRRVLAARRLPAHVVVGVDGLPSGEREPAWRRLLLRPQPWAARRARPPALPLDRAALDAVVSALRAEGATVLVVDRPTGRLLQHGARRVGLEELAAAGGRAA